MALLTPRKSETFFAYFSGVGSMLCEQYKHPQGYEERWKWPASTTIEPSVFLFGRSENFLNKENNIFFKNSQMVVSEFAFIKT